RWSACTATAASATRSTRPPTSTPSGSTSARSPSCSGRPRNRCLEQPSAAPDRGDRLAVGAAEDAGDDGEDRLGDGAGDRGGLVGSGAVEGPGEERAALDRADLG